MHQGVRYAGLWAALVWAGGLCGGLCTVACAQHIHPSLRQTPCVAMLKGLLFKFDTPYVLANVCEAVPETTSLLANSYYQIQKKRRRWPFAAVIKIQIDQTKRPVRYRSA
jgi:hypothetical protein